MRGFVLVVTVVAGCAHGGKSPAVDKCTATRGADPGACVAVADAKQKSGDDRAATEYVEAAVDAIDVAPACLRDYDARGCFQAVALLLEEPVGLFADVHVSHDLQILAPKQSARDRAYAALKTMCTSPARDSGEQQRACIVLGDLDEIDRAQRCGDKCDKPNEGYAAACKLGQTSLAGKIRGLYATDACGIATSAKRGASIADGTDTLRRIREDTRARQEGARVAAEREGARLALMAAAAAADATRAQREEYEADAKQLVSALDSANWEVAYDLIKKRDAKSPIDEGGAAALARNWDSFISWAIHQSTPMAVYLDIADGLGTSAQLTALRERALLDLNSRAQQTRGLAGQWLYAALVAKLGGDSKHAAVLYGKLVGQIRVSLVIDRLSPACTPLIKQGAGRKVRASSTLECSVVPNRKWTTQESMVVKQRVVKDGMEEDVETTMTNDVEHYGFAITVHGTLIVGGKAVRIDFEDVGDETSNRTFAQAHAAAIEAIVASVEAADAAKAYAAAKQALTVKRQAAAENQLVIHAVLAGSSPELDELLSRFGVSFSELLPL